MRDSDHGSCKICQKRVGQEDRFCASCGAPVGFQHSDVERYLDSVLPGRLDKLLQDRLKDQRVVELETTELVANRAISWLKIVGFFVGIPVALLIGILSFFGIRTYSDLHELSQRLSKPEAQLTDVQNKIASLEAGAKIARHRVDNLTSQQKATAGQLKKLLNSTQRDKIKGFIERFATGSYNRTLPSKDDVQFGLDEWSLTHSDDFDKIFNSYCKTPAAELGAQLMAYGGRVHSRDRSLAGDRTFLQLLHNAGSDPVMQKLEDMALDGDLDNNMAVASKFGLQKPLSIAIIAHLASWLGGGVVEQMAITVAGAPTKGGDEEKWTKAFLSLAEKKYASSKELDKIFDFYEQHLKIDDWQLSKNVIRSWQP